MLGLEKWLARVLLLNSALTLAVCLGLLGEVQDGSRRMLMFGMALLGFLAAVLALKRHVAGLWGGMLYYLPQVLSYYRFDQSWQFSVKAGVSIGLSLRFADGVLILNLLALTLLGATASILYWRRQSA
ncbi:hypothetical protein KW842_19855 [Duganella sp. sic0402]|uniref:hypothetical protein n=1 Tax=Duganella sp. sic0402 TaxID=2854786 RepID=UPI001C439F5C|nr:hypothetical protein [Duganella sp. sic0402]MBV7538032.1 hypothetical protein [Duganella sp. sic0402]